MKNPFTLPSDNEIFLLRDREKQRKIKVILKHTLTAVYMIIIVSHIYLYIYLFFDYYYYCLATTNNMSSMPVMLEKLHWPTVEYLQKSQYCPRSRGSADFIPCLHGSTH